MQSTIEREVKLLADPVRIVTLTAKCGNEQIWEHVSQTTGCADEWDEMTQFSIRGYEVIMGEVETEFIDYLTDFNERVSFNIGDIDPNKLGWLQQLDKDFDIILNADYGLGPHVEAITQEVINGTLANREGTAALTISILGSLAAILVEPALVLVNKLQGQKLQFIDSAIRIYFRKVLEKQCPSIVTGIAPYCTNTQGNPQDYIVERMAAFVFSLITGRPSVDIISQ